MSNRPTPIAGIVEDWRIAEPQLPIRTLLPTAIRALYEEDTRLAQAFRQGRQNERVSGRSHGLGYWVFETTLVYTIFKSWLPIVETDWEATYPSTTEAADLLVWTDEAPNLAFEAKWWMSSAADPDLLRDVEKLRAWRELNGRYLLTFWRSPNTSEMWRSDLASVQAFCDRHEVTLIYVAAFPTDEAATRASTGSYFAMAALAV